jgi:hypothetical protein
LPLFCLKKGIRIAWIFFQISQTWKLNMGLTGIQSFSVTYFPSTRSWSKCQNAAVIGFQWHYKSHQRLPTMECNSKERKHILFTSYPKAQSMTVHNNTPFTIFNEQ